MEQQNNPHEMEHNRTCAIQLLTYKKKNHLEVIEVLKERGMDEESATTMTLNLIDELRNAKKQEAKNEMIQGALWLLGGIAATYLSMEVIFKDKPISLAFWGAIVYGGYKFFKGLLG